MQNTNAVPESAIRSRLNAIARTLSDLHAEQKSLESLLKYSVPVGGAVAVGPAVRLEQGGLIDGVEVQLTPRDAILRYVGENPGRTPTEIADALIGRVATKSKDVRNVLRTTVAKMAGTGQFRKESGNRIFPK